MAKGKLVASTYVIYKNNSTKGFKVFVTSIQILMHFFFFKKYMVPTYLCQLHTFKYPIFLWEFLPKSENRWFRQMPRSWWILGWILFLTNHPTHNSILVEITTISSESKTSRIVQRNWKSARAGLQQFFGKKGDQISGNSCPKLTL